MRLHLIRHGQSISNAEGRVQGHLDVPLSDQGIREAELLADRLVSLPIAALYTSPLKRAHRTAQTVAERLDIKLQARDFLMERDVGELSGLTGDEIGEKFPAWRERRYLTNAQDIVPGYEGDEPFNERVIPNMRALIEAHSDQELAVVTHGGVIGAFCRHALGITKRRSASIDNGSLTTFDIRDGFTHVQLILLNDTCHLNE